MTEVVIGLSLHWVGGPTYVPIRDDGATIDHGQQERRLDEAALPRGRVAADLPSAVEDDPWTSLL